MKYNLKGVLQPSSALAPSRSLSCNLAQREFTACRFLSNVGRNREHMEYPILLTKLV